MQLTYLCLQPRDGAGASDVHVDAIIAGLQARGHVVHLVEPRARPSTWLPGKAVAAIDMQLRARRWIRRSDAVYVRLHPVAVLSLPFLGRRRLLVEVNGVPADFSVANPTLARFENVVRWGFRRVLRAADHVIVVTEGLGRRVHELAPSARTVVIPNAADPRCFRPGLPRPADAPQGAYALYFGALAKWQGLDLLLDAVTRAAWPPDLHLLIIGDGAMREPVVAAAMRAPDRVIYLGSRPASALPNYLANASMTMMLKRYHDPVAGQSPLKLYESAAAGVPIVATVMHGVTDRVELLDAMVQVADRPEAVAEAVARLHTDRESAASVGRSGREAVLASENWDARAAVLAELLVGTSKTSDEQPRRDSPRLSRPFRKTSRVDNSLPHAHPEKGRPPDGDEVTESGRRGLDSLAATLHRHGVRFWVDSGVLLGLKRAGKINSWESDIDLAVMADQLPALLATLRGLESAGYATDVKRYRGRVYAVGLRPTEKRQEDDLRAAVHVYYPVGNYLCSPQAQIYVPPPAPEVLGSPRSSAGRAMTRLLDRWLYRTANGQPTPTPRPANAPASLPYRLARSAYRRIDRGRLAELWPIREVYVPLTWVVPRDLVLPLSTLEVEDAVYPVPKDVEGYLQYRYGDWRTPVREWHYWADDGAIVAAPPKDVLARLRRDAGPST